MILGAKRDTARTHVGSILRKLNVENRTGGRYSFWSDPSGSLVCNRLAGDGGLILPPCGNWSAISIQPTSSA
jgi:hypothetical protein